MKLGTFMHEYNIIRQHVGDGYKMLDFGCGRGKIYEEYFKPEGMDVEYVGIDIDTSLDVDFPLFHSVDEFIEADYPKRYFDGLALLDVIEHLPHQEMYEVLEKLNPYIDGDIFIMTPNSKCLDLLFSDAQHKTIYPLDELVNLVKHLGFEIKELRKGKGLFHNRSVALLNEPHREDIQKMLDMQRQVCTAIGLDWYANILLIGGRSE
jgi:2-polyprenyl-3-methyl-5-hydroxy-6-metoxy-1,4-benzoquinol methylase